MEKWQLYAVSAAVFAGTTAVLAKAGLKTLGPDLGLVIRTGFVLLFVVANLFLWSRPKETLDSLQDAGARAFLLLGLSALTTALSWVCYYRAMKEGEVSQVALIDKGSIVVTVILSVLLLGEPMSWRLAISATLVFAGLVVLATG